MVHRSSGSTGVRAPFFVVAVGLAAVELVACNALLDFDAFKIGAGDGGPPSADVNADDGGHPNDSGESVRDAEGGADADPCVDPDGFGGRGCFRCTPSTNDELLGACTSSAFEPFDNTARIVAFDPAHPKPDLPSPDAGPPRPAPFPRPEGQDAGGSAGSCRDLGYLNRSYPVTILGTTGLAMDAIAKAMGPSGEDPPAATIFFSEVPPCVAVANAVKNNHPLGGGNDVLVFDGVTGSSTKCTLEESFNADIDLSSLFLESCANSNGLGSSPALPAGTVDVLGPVLPVVFATPTASPEKVISAEAAYKVYGFPNSGVAPWTDENFIFQRTASADVQRSIARALGLAANGLRGRSVSDSATMKFALQSSSQPNQTLGLSPSEIVDVDRGVLRALAFQHVHQPVGFYPDSTPTAFDRRNVRDGHYSLWLALHVFTKTEAGEPVASDGNTELDAITPKADRDEAVKRLVAVMTSQQAPVVAGVDYFAAMKRIGSVPQCAMGVTRATDSAPLAPSKPAMKCGCAYEAASPGMAPPECQTCSSASTCPSNRPTCSFGYCE